MIVKPPSTHIVYRCHDCGTAIYGLVGKFSLAASMLRLKCSCGASALDINITNDKKIRLSVPCLFCKTNHSFVLSESIFWERDIFMLNCPYSNMDICFIGEKDKCDAELKRSAEELEKLFASLEAEELKDIQPSDINEEDVLPDATVYDKIRFLLSSLVEEESIDCPCHNGSYDLRFAPHGIEIYCENCGATHFFDTSAEAAVDDYLEIDELKLT